MKRLDILCPSQASTAICLSMDQASCSSSNTIQLGGKAIDRHNPIINDSRRTTSKIVTYNDHQKAKKESSSSSKPITIKEENNNKKISKKGHEQKKKKSTEEKVTEHVTTTTNNYYSSKPIDSVMRKSWIKPNADLATTPAGSTRCLLSDSALLDGISDYDPVLALSTSIDNKRVQVVQQDEISTSSKPSSSNLPKSGSSDQVVVLRVSLHCKGCEGKVRKHLSRMQGVSSFNIDFAAKKVIVVGDVTPLSVLASISKVKNAQFWPASASAMGYGTIETMKNNVYN